MSFTREEILRMVRGSEEEIPQRLRYYGVYIGLVEDNRDPLKLNRLKVRTPLSPDPEGMPTQAIKWAHYLSPAGGSKDVGFYSVPPVGSQVAVKFVDGDPSYPVWVGAVWGAPKGVSDTYVTRIAEQADDGGFTAPELWDFTKYTSFTTPYGHRLIFDDNVQKNTLDQVANYAEIRLDSPRGFGLEIKEDKEQDFKDPGTDHRGTLRVFSRDRRVMLFDDDAEQITISSPEGHMLRMDSPLDVVFLQTEKLNRLRMEDPAMRIDLSTPGDDPDDQRGYRLLLDQPNLRALLKGDEHRYFLEMLETSGGHIGLFSKYPLKRDAAIGILDFYVGAQKDVVNLYANDGQGFNRNGMLFDRGETQANRSQAIYLYDDNRNAPTNWIRLVSRARSAGETDGMIVIGRSDRTNTIVCDPSPIKIEIRTADLGLRARRIVMDPQVGKGDEDLLTLNGPFKSQYFKHVHPIVFDPNSSVSQHVLNAVQWALSNVVLAGSGTFPGGTGAFNITTATGTVDVKKSLLSDKPSNNE